MTKTIFDMRNHLLVGLFLCFHAMLLAQKMPVIQPKDLEKLSILEDSMSVLAEIAVWDTTRGQEEARREAGEKLNLLWQEALKIPASFSYAFHKLQNISVQTPEDNSFRIITFQTFIHRNEFQYYGYVQMNQARSKFFVLHNESSTLLSKPDETEQLLLNAEKWLGCVYYKLKSFKSADGSLKHLLFGFNSYNDYEKVKVCDVITVRGNKVSFGAAVFNLKKWGKPPRLQKRIIQTYSAEAAMRFNYDEAMAMIIHDHLTPGNSRNPDIPYVLVPDGTYEAFELKKGIWEHIVQLPTTPLSEAPREKPVLEKKAKVVNKENAKAFQFPEQN